MNDNEYETSDLSTTTHLVATGEQLLRMDCHDPKRVVFCFRDTPKVRKAVEEFWSGAARVEPLHLLQTQKLLKQRIYAHKQP